MSLLTYNELLEVARNGYVTGVNDSNINAASIDVHLGSTLLVESDIQGSEPYIDLTKPTGHHLMVAPISRGLNPGEFGLAHTVEELHLPDFLACEFKLKSSLARSGLNHALAGWTDPGFHDATLTLELTNQLQRHRLLLKSGMKIGQLVFYRGDEVPLEASYAHRGRYNGQGNPTTSKGLA